MKKIHISTLGCKVNQYESASFQTGFEERGHHIVTADTESDIVVINTCTVTGKAGAQSRQELRKALRKNPRAKIIVTGCYSQLESDEIIAMDELKNRSVSIVGNGDKHLLVDLALQEDAPISALKNDIADRKEISHLPVNRFGSRTRAYLRIQDGCNAFCTYCIVPYTRGRSRSLPVQEVLRQAKIFSEQGYKEIVITGIHVGYYGADLADNIDISSIMSMLCNSTPEIRYRLSSIEPLEISPKIIEVMQENSNFMPHLHIPLQSGNDEILVRRNRRYATGQFKEKLEYCREKIKDIAIGIDILAGFPGETDIQFNQAYEFVDSLDFTYLHVFPYSKRPGTPAASYDSQVDKQVKNSRVEKLRELGEIKKKTFYRRYLDSVRPTLVENKRSKNGLLKGFTDNYIPVSFKGEDELKKTVVQIKLEKGDAKGIIGKVV